MGQHPAGLRTHILVALGAAAYTIAGTYGVLGQGFVRDPTRVAAQIVTGVGFLGAGTIWRSGSDRIIYGLTTAASIWVAASIGMLMGFGQYLLAAGCAVMGFLVLGLLKPLESAPLSLARPRLRRSYRPAGARPVAVSAPDVAAGVDIVNGAAVQGAPRSPTSPPRGPKKGRKRTRGGKGTQSVAELEPADHISDAPPPQS
jgi:hypothetical protein